MRDGPATVVPSPHPEMVPASSSTSSTTSTLLKEISVLRGRLKELEEDNKSWTSTGDDKGHNLETTLTIMLRADLAKIEQEKANLEKELLNQMSCLQKENQEKVNNLQHKLEQAESTNRELQRRVLNANSSNEKEQCMRMLQEERDRHAKEMERMKENIQSSDLEITESRREMDHLHETLFEAQTHKEQLLEEVTKLRPMLTQEQLKSASLESQVKELRVEVDKLKADCKGKDLIIERKTEEIGEMNDTIIKLEGHKEMLVQDNKDVRAQLLKKEDVNIPSKPSTPKQLIVGRTEAAITPDEKQQLEKDVLRLEERLQRFHAKLSEKDKAIEQLASSLTEERKLNKHLRAEVKNRKGSDPSNATIAIEQVASRGESDPIGELDSLRKQNKQLTDEVKALRFRSSTSPERSTKKIQSLHSVSHVQNPTRTARTPIVADIPTSPRTPVQGLVATFERRISKSTMDESSASLNSTFMLKADLEKERALVVELQEKLRAEEAVVEDLKAKVQCLSVPSLPAGIEERLRESEEKVEGMKEKIQQYELSQSTLEQRILTHQAENEQLRDRVDRFVVKEVDLESKIAKYEQELNGLKSELLRVKDEGSSERSELQGIISSKEAELDQLRNDLKNATNRAHEEEKKEELIQEEELSRLRSQISALQPELESALAQIEISNREIASLKQSLLQAEQKTTAISESTIPSQKLKKQFEEEINAIKIQLTETQIAKANLELECSKRIKELENEIEVVEVAAEEELEDKDKELEKLKEVLATKEKEISRLEVERQQLCSSMNDLSTSRRDDLDTLESELIDIKAKNASLEREIQSLKMKLDEYNNCEESESKLKDRIKHLEEEIKVLNWTSRNTVHQGDIDSLKKENKKLRDAIRDVKNDRRTLQDRLDSLLSDKSASKSSQVLRERNESLKQEVEKLTRRLKKMEDSITRFAI